MNVTVIDFETTGLDIENDRVLEMAAVKYIDAQSVTPSVLKLTLNINLEELKKPKTKISQKILNKGIPEDIAFDFLYKFIGNDTIVSHNILHDYGFLYFSMKRLFDVEIKNPFLDTLSLSRVISPYPHTLKDMCRKLNIEYEQYNKSSLTDCFACLNLYVTLEEDEEQIFKKSFYSAGLLGKDPVNENEYIVLDGEFKDDIYCSIDDFENYIIIFDRYKDPSWLPPNAILKKIKPVKK